MSLETAQYTVDVVRGRCHIMQNANMQSIYSSDKIFEAINYAANNVASFKISDVAELWIDIESHEELMKALKERSHLFDKCA